MKLNAEDPTNSKTQRKAFRQAFGKRWREARGQNRDWWTQRSQLDRPGTQGEYRQFIESMLTSIVLESAAPRQITDGRHWTGTYITTAYDKGLRLAEADMSALGANEGKIASAVRRNREPHRTRIQQQYESIYYTTRDHVTFAVSKATDKLRQAVENGYNTDWMANQTNRMIRKKVRSRYRSAANTSVIRTINDAMLAAFEKAGVSEVGVAVENGVGSVDVRSNMRRVNAEGELVFTTAGDTDVCPTCRSLAGRTVKISEVKNQPQFQPPVHPNCRCRLVATEMETGGETIEAPENGPTLQSQ